MNIETLIVGPIEVNCYIVYDENGNGVVIDAGGEADEILEVIRQNNVNPRYILLTHGHFDHIGAVVEVKNETGATIVMHPADQFLIQQAPQQAAMFGMPAVQIFDVDQTVTEGDIITAGTLQAKVIETPGHSPGGVCYLFDNTLFAGDVLFYDGIGRTDLPGGSMSQLLNSIKNKIFTLPNECRVLCGHGPATTIGREKKQNPFISGAFQ